jgi:hypothetical protein
MDIIEKFLHNISYKFPKGYPDMKDENDVILLENILTNFIGENIECINEVALSPSQLEKPYPPRSESAQKYKDRGEYFLEKLLNGDEFELNDGSKIILDPEQSQEAIKNLQSKLYKNLGGTKKLLTSTDGNLYSLSNFKKTKEFGSGSGQGGGAVNTSVQESSQCLFNSLAYHVVGGDIAEDDINDKSLEEAFKYCDVTNTLDEMKQFSQDQSWLDTMILAANTSINNFPNKSFQFHRGSKFVQGIYNAYKIASKNEGISMQSDKWNPADIWMVDPSILSYEFPTTLQELNADILNLYSDNKLIGVSLKKLGKSAKLTIENASQDDLKQHSVEAIESKPTNKGSQIIYDSGKIYFRTFNFATNFAGEILGKTANHGKIGTGAINDVLKYNNLPPIPHSKDIKTGFETKNQSLIDQFVKNYKIIDSTLDESDIINLVETKDIDYLVSKYMAVFVGASILNQPQDQQNEIISDMLRYASSTTKSSSVFVKIS